MPMTTMLATRAARTLLTTTLVALIGTSAAVAQDEPEAAASPDPAASPAVEVAPIPTFDPSVLDIRIELLEDGFAQPVYVADDGADAECLYVVEKGGTVRLFADGRIRPDPWLDISRNVGTLPEQGLHAIAFHPQFPKNRKFYVHYNDRQGRTRVEEYKGRACRGTVRPKPSKRILTIEQPLPNNNGGWIGFGPKGNLHILLGDGGGVSPGDPEGLGQDKGTQLAKVLRVNVNKGKTYAIPNDNPFAKKKRGFPRETWARGLRDPRRGSFDRQTGDLWIGDEGQDRFQEIDRIPSGQKAMNFGWSDMEGDLCHNLVDCDPTAYDLPVHTYDDTQPQCGVVGGYVYRGEAIPDLDGVYVFSDRCSGFVWGLDADALAEGAEVVAHQLLDGATGFVSFGEDDAGELYLVALDGSLYRIEAEATG